MTAAISAPLVPTVDDLVSAGFTRHTAARALAYVDSLNLADAKDAGARHGGRYAHFTIETKKAGKYVRVVMDTSPGSGYGGSVHAFIVKATGQVAKPAGWAGPSRSTAAGRKGEIIAKYTLTDDDSFIKLLEDVAKPGSFAGGYLYQ